MTGAEEKDVPADLETLAELAYQIASLPPGSQAELLATARGLGIEFRAGAMTYAQVETLRVEIGAWLVREVLGWDVSGWSFE